MEVMALQLLKADESIVVTLLGIVMEVSEVQFRKVPKLIAIKDALVGSVTEVREVQFRNANKSIVVTLLGIVMEVMALQF